MPTLLHISDLHRTSQPLLSNDELLAAFVSDARRWEPEGIPWPELVVVSGDLIHGASIDTTDADSQITDQYGEADDLLRKLAAEFVDSDRSRVVVVPGNHDVDWGRARSAMKPLATCPAAIATKGFEAGSGVRWNWREQQAYEIIDSGLYDSRYEHFRRFQAGFYAGLDPSPLAHSDAGLVFAEYPSLGLVVVGFASWYGNDCFCHIGEIDPESLALSRKLLAGSTAQVAVAVWHHSVVGGPRAYDYMDQRVIQRLIDFGFTVGLHGHQHYPGAAPFELRLPNLTAMAVVGAGSLAVGDSELPMGERRQFNVIEIDKHSKSITVNVRAMSNAGVFTASHRDDFDGNTFITLSLPSSPARPKEPTSTQRLDEAMNAVALRQYEKALDLLPHIDPSHSHEKRQIKIESLDGLRRWDELIELLDQPQSVDETVRVISLLLDARQFDEATARLDAASTFVSTTLFDDLAATIASTRMTS